MTSWTHRTVTNNHILPYVDSNTAEPAVRDALRTLPFERNIFKLLANSESFFPTFMKFLSCAWSPNNKIRTSDWQTIVLYTAASLDAPYEWDVNEPVARILGFSSEQLDLIRAKDLSSPTLFKDRHRIIAEMVDQMVKGSKVEEQTMEKAKNMFGDEGVMEIMFTHGIYGMIARIMNSARIDFDPPIPGLEEMLKKFNAAAIEKEKTYTD